MSAVYAKVVIEVIHANCINVKLDYPTLDTEIYTLEDAKNQFILWPMRDIILDIPTPPAQSTSPMASLQKIIEPIGPSQLGDPTRGSTPTPPAPLSPARVPMPPSSGLPPSPPRGLPADDTRPSAMQTTSTPERRAQLAPLVVSPVLDLYDPVAAPMTQMHSRDMPEDAKSWLQATKRQRYMPSL